MKTAAFQKKFDELHDLLFAFAMKLTRDKENAKDLIQETACRAFKHRNKFKEGTNFKAWLTTIMRNTFINDYRKRRTRNQVEAPIEDFLFALENKSITGNGAKSSLMMKELTGMLDKLSDLYRVPFLLFYQGFQYHEIAKQLGIPMGTVKSRIFFARKKMKKMIVARYGEGVRAA
ncbi:MAG TPA: RNA polymerase sigma factor [Saprospiraceae bacterium]|nr:RNA polymerase sigma factor [Saprospiraceae bacterium]